MKFVLFSTGKLALVVVILEGGVVDSYLQNLRVYECMQMVPAN